MFLFSRQVRLAPGDLRDSVAHSVAMAERVTRITGLQVDLWTRMFSAGVGTLAYTTWVENLADLEAANDKLAVDNEYNEAIAAGSKYFAGLPDDAIASLVHGTIDPEARPEYVSAVQAICSSGNLAKGYALGMKIVDLAGEITGTNTLFCGGATGPYGNVAWFTGHATVSDLQQSEATLYADPRFVELLDSEGAGVYAETPELTQQIIWRRVV